MLPYLFTFHYYIFGRSTRYARGVRNRCCSAEDGIRKERRRSDGIGIVTKSIPSHYFELSCHEKQRRRSHKEEKVKGLLIAVLDFCDS